MSNGTLLVGVLLLVRCFYFADSTNVGLERTNSRLFVDKFWNYNAPLSGPANIRWKAVEGCGNEEYKSNVVCIHGFGGNADQFRANMPYLDSMGHRTYAMDLLGYGYSDKPDPKAYEVNSVYNFENWADQTVKFVQNVVKEPTYLVCNSVGGVVGLQAALLAPELIKGVVLINISMRMLHVTKQAPAARPFISAFQTLLRETALGPLFFSQIAQREGLRNILRQAYADPNAVDDETLDIILKPGLLPGAAPVFLDFISYSGGPLPEELLAQVECPVRILWGERDPWEPLEQGREQFSSFPCVDSFVTLPGAGHCPMDQVPDLVNAELLKYLDTYSKEKKKSN
eukprot:gene9022-18681_t